MTERSNKVSKRSQVSASTLTLRPAELAASAFTLRGRIDHQRQKNVHTLENLTKIYEELEERVQAIQWLVLAENMACSLLSGVTESVTTDAYCGEIKQPTLQGRTMLAWLMAL